MRLAVETVSVRGDTSTGVKLASVGVEFQRKSHRPADIRGQPSNYCPYGHELVVVMAITGLWSRTGASLARSCMCGESHKVIVFGIGSLVESRQLARSRQRTTAQAKVAGRYFDETFKAP
jgi:hypothetical protein